MQSNKGKCFEPKENAVYLPLFPSGKATTSVSDLTLKQHNCVQIVFDTLVAKAEYVAEFFNSHLGRLLRESTVSGYIPK